MVSEYMRLHGSRYLKKTLRAPLEALVKAALGKGDAESAADPGFVLSCARRVLDAILASGSTVPTYAFPLRRQPSLTSAVPRPIVDALDALRSATERKFTGSSRFALGG